MLVAHLLRQRPLRSKAELLFMHCTSCVTWKPVYPCVKYMYIHTYILLNRRMTSTYPLGLDKAMFNNGTTSGFLYKQP